MIIKRELFSEKKNYGLKAASASALIAGSTLSNKLGESFSKKMGDILGSSEITAKDKDIIKDKLMKEARKQGTRIFKDSSYPNSAYTNTINGKISKKILAKLVKTVPKHQRKKVIDSIKDGNKIINHVGKDRIVLGEGNLSEVDVLSHELGHSKYSVKGRSKNIIAKGSHKLTPLGRASFTKFGVGLSAAHGFHSGRKQVQKENKGEKVSFWDKSKSIALPIAAVTPLLISEGSASLKGLKMMKKAGASKELIKQSKKRLGAALGTYIGKSSKPVVSGTIGNEVGKLYEKSVNKKEKRKKIES